MMRLIGISRVSPSLHSKDYTEFFKMKMFFEVSVSQSRGEHGIATVTRISMAENNHRIIPVRGLTIGVILVLLFALFAIPMLISNTSISGEEFSPQLFQKRKFAYRRFPGTKIRISNTKLSPASSPSSKSILSHLSSGVQTEWHVSTVQQGGYFQELGPKILIDYLQSTNADGSNIWDAWSFQNPSLASVLWPIVQQVASRELYFCIPDLLRNADSQLDMNTMKKSLLIVCTHAAKAKLKSLVETKDTLSEEELRSWALSLTSDFGTDPEFQELRSELSKP